MKTKKLNLKKVTIADFATDEIMGGATNLCGFLLTDKICPQKTYPCIIPIHWTIPTDPRSRCCDETFRFNITEQVRYFNRY